MDTVRRRTIIHKVNQESGFVSAAADMKPLSCSAREVRKCVCWKSSGSAGWTTRGGL